VIASQISLSLLDVIAATGIKSRMQVALRTRSDGAQRLTSYELWFREGYRALAKRELKSVVLIDGSAHTDEIENDLEDSCVSAFRISWLNQGQ